MRIHKKHPNDQKKRPKIWGKMLGLFKKNILYSGDQVVKNRNYEDVKKQLKQPLPKMARAGRLNALE